MTEEQQRQREAAFIAEMRVIDQEFPPLTMSLTRTECFMLLAQMQLALRHPRNTGSAADWARALAQQLQEAVSVKPMMAAIAEGGWHPECDI